MSLKQRGPILPPPAEQPRRRAPLTATPDEPVSWWRWLADPRSAVLLTMGSLILVGGGRRLWIARRSRQAIDKLQVDNPAAADIEAAVEFGRDGLIDFFRILGTAEDKASRDAAGRALAELWRRNELIMEEEKALIRRGIQIEWIGRRRYPRALKEMIQLRVVVSVPFLNPADPEVGDDIVDLSSFQWKHKVTGTQRAGLEVDSPWQPIPFEHPVEIAVAPGDFASTGPHRLVLESSIRTAKSKEAWTIDLPHMPFSFEFDAHLDINAIKAAHDEARERFFAENLRLESPSQSTSIFADISPDFAIRNPPALIPRAPLPSDLAHRVEIEVEGISERIDAGTYLATEKGPHLRVPGKGEPLTFRTRLKENPGERPGEIRIRAYLHPDPHLAWAAPEVRSLWPGTIVTDWVTVSTVRR